MWGRHIENDRIELEDDITLFECGVIHEHNIYSLEENSQIKVLIKLVSIEDFYLVVRTSITIQELREKINNKLG